MTGKWQNTECYHQSPFSSPVPSISFLDIYIPHISSQVFCRWKEEKMIDISVRKLIRISLKWWTVLRECPNLRAINLLTACRKSAKKRNGLSLKFCSMLLFLRRRATFVPLHAIIIFLKYCYSILSLYLPNIHFLDQMHWFDNFLACSLCMVKNYQE